MPLPAGRGQPPCAGGRCRVSPPAPRAVPGGGCGAPPVGGDGAASPPPRRSLALRLAGPGSRHGSGSAMLPGDPGRESVAVRDPEPFPFLLLLLLTPGLFPVSPIRSVPAGPRRARPQPGGELHGKGEAVAPAGSPPPPQQAVRPCALKRARYPRWAVREAVPSLPGPGRTVVCGARRGGGGGGSGGRCFPPGRES